jgi:excisionase family DNA binding protein
LKTHELAKPDATAEDIAQMLNISVRGVYRLAESGKIPSYRAERLLRFDRQEVLAALRSEAA